tara:strand:- start:2009 stop:2941 length:933 start_codon:yes stop_codon:yes gene_type:complete
MKPEERIVTFPIIGKESSDTLREFFESLDLKVQTPPPTTDKTVRLGVAHSPDMMCFPYKVTLGNLVEAIDAGANTLIMYDSQGQCRFRQYNKLHEFTLRQLGHDFEMYPITLKSLVPVMSRVSGKSWLEVFKKVAPRFKSIVKDDERSWSEDKPNIGIIGEIYCCVDEVVNSGLEDQIRALDANPYNTSKVPAFLWESLRSALHVKDTHPFNRKLAGYKREAREYFNGPLGGHSFENLYNLLELTDRGIDGVVHVLPLSCMPESTIEPYINQICSDKGIPLLRIPIDENNSAANLATRLETFVELIKWKK